jgi:RNA polymerase sigma-70 factor, ECF subfamily
MGPLVEAFIAAAPKLAAGGVPGLEQRLALIVEAAALELPRVRRDDAAFVAHLAARLDPALPLGEALDQLRAADLYLAWGCSRNDPAAIERFERELMPQGRAIVARRLPGQGELEEVLQAVRQHLVAGPEGTPRISDYRGYGALASWLRVVAVRTAMNLSRRTAPERLPSQSLSFGAAAQGDPELLFLKETYREPFKTAFRSAVSTLDAEERGLLRLHFLEGVSLEQMGLLYRAHKSTLSRRLARVRKDLFDRTRAALCSALAVDSGEIDSVIRLFQSELDMSLISLLRD